MPMSRSIHRGPGYDRMAIVFRVTLNLTPRLGHRKFLERWLQSIPASECVVMNVAAWNDVEARKAAYESLLARGGEYWPKWDVDWCEITLAGVSDVVIAHGKEADKT